VRGTTSGKVGTFIDSENAPHDVYVYAARPIEYLIPAVDEFVKRIDIAAGIMVIEPITGIWIE
jgi:ribosomal 30S subunit maturation factor RimM